MLFRNHALNPRPRRLAMVGIMAIALGTGVACAESTSTATIEPAELVVRLADGSAPMVLDVRTEKEYRSGHIPGAILIPHDELEARIDELPTDKASEIVVHCQSGRRAGIAEAVLQKHGFTKVRDLTGHWKAWSSAGRPTQASE